MRLSSRLTLCAGLIALVAFAGPGCKQGEKAMSSAPSSKTGPGAVAEKSLYDRLGGEAALKAVIGEFVSNLAADNRINHFFAETNLENLKTQLVNLIGQASGGPQKYTGRDMKTTHTGLGVASADFNALVEDLTRALDKFSVPEKEKGELLAILAPMKSDIVEKP